MASLAKLEFSQETIQIRLFGELSIYRAGRPLALPASKKTRALLAYLVTSQRSHTRERLCDFLWEGPDDPRAALRWSLTKIRPLVDEPGMTRLIADRERVSFESRGATTDLHDLRALVSNGFGQKATQMLESAAESIKGELLEGLDLPDCYQYNEWCRAEREAARRLGRTIRIALVARLENDPEKALGHARALTATDPLDQTGHAAVIRLLGNLGRSKEALRQYEICRQMLSAQLHVTPSVDVEQARMGIGLPQLPSPDSPVAIPLIENSGLDIFCGNNSYTLIEPATDYPLDIARSPFVGRESEYAALGEFIAGGALPGKQLLLVLGEPGVGKSRLLAELAGMVHAKGGRVLRGRAFEAEMVRPYGAWIDALRALDPKLDTPSPFVDRANIRVEATMDRGRLFESVVDRLSRLETDGKLTTVIIDDIQWIDEASAALIHYAARALAGSRVRIACAARPGELGDNFAALRLVRTMTREGKVQQIGLSPLDATSTAALALSAYPGVDTARVFEESGGNPMYALEVARALDRGEGPTSSLDALLQDRLDRLEGIPRALVAWAAIFGRAFSLDLLLSVAGFATGDFLSAVEELERRGFIRSVNMPEIATGYDFAHDLLRRAAYQAMSEPRRRLMHLAIARALAKLPDTGASLAGDIAHHAAMGEDAELAARFSLVAAERCLRLCAAREATELADRGLRLTARLDVAVRTRLEVGLLSVAIIADVGKRRTQALEESMRQALVKAQAAGFKEEVTRGLMALSYLHFDQGNFYDAQLDSLRMTEAARSANPDQTLRALAHAAQCLALLERDMGKAEALASEAKSLAEQQELEVLELLLAQGFILQYQGEVDSGIEILKRGSALAEQQGAFWLGAVTLVRLAIGELQRGRPTTALDHCSRLREVVGRLGESSEGPLGEIIEAVARRDLHESRDPLDIDRALDALAAFDAQAYLGEAYCLVAESDLQAGDAAGAKRRAQRALRAAEVIARPTYIVWARALLAQAAHELGDLEEARMHLEAALPMLEAEPCPSAHARERIAAAVEACPRVSVPSNTNITIQQYR
jgi:DNA-binding SARP family transcriptional activator/tetratricopeptide (TPR) repeat protein/energy-coupling factor transporter ATP-binding protein EcfA2